MKNFIFFLIFHYYSKILFHNPIVIKFDERMITFTHIKHKKTTKAICQ